MEMIVTAAAFLAALSPSSADQDGREGTGVVERLRNSDRPFIDAHPGIVSRQGKTLVFKNSETLTDEGNCEEGDCTEYRVDGVWLGRFVGIDVQQYEEGGYLIVNLGVNNSQVWVGARPIPSPDGKLFFVGYHDDRDWDAYQGASVWEFGDQAGPNRLRVVDTNLVAFTEFTAWRGNDCVEFKGARGYNRGMEKVRTFWLARQKGDWQLLETRADVCR